MDRALGLVVAPLIGLDVLAPLAATGLALMMIGAAITHVRRREVPMVAINAVLGVLAAVVAIGRF